MKNHCKAPHGNYLDWALYIVNIQATISSKTIVSKFMTAGHMMVGSWSKTYKGKSATLIVKVKRAKTRHYCSTVALLSLKIKLIGNLQCTESCEIIWAKFRQERTESKYETTNRNMRYLDPGYNCTTSNNELITK